MFNRITGTVTAKNAGGVCIATGGIEWDITASALDSGALPGAGETGSLFCWLYHREDRMELFGFSDEKRRAAFLELLKVEGIGPKAAVKIMGGIGLSELEKALDAGDLARLEAVPGLGKKTAQKMLLALKGKLARHDGADAALSPFNELAGALVSMGYDKKQALDALAKAAESLKDKPGGPPPEGTERENALFRKAILYLSGA